MKTEKVLLAITIMVKDESGSIAATLSPFVNAGIRHFFVLDTGSTDNTVQVTQDFFRQYELEGHILQEPFIDFSTSRNRTLQLAEDYFPQAVFFLMPDAEWYLHNPRGLLEFCEQEKNAVTPLYNIRSVMQSTEFSTTRLFRVASHIRFKGVVHEVPEQVSTVQVPSAVFFKINASDHGVEKSKQRWNRDLVLLFEYHHNNPDDPRTAFYLAQTYECLGMLPQAYQYYQYRDKLEGWVEENFITLLRLGSLAEQLGQQGHATISWQTAMDYYLKAFALRPHRIEPLVKIADHYWPDNIPTCYLFAQYAYSIPYPANDMLFVDKEMYEYTRYEIMSRCAWHLGEYELGQQATLRALKIYPNTEHLLRNLHLYEEKLATASKNSLLL